MNTHTERGSKSKSILILIIGISAVSTAAIFIRLAQESTSSMIIALGRMSISGFVLLIPFLIRYRYSLHTLTIRDYFGLMGASIFLALHFAAWISSLEYTDVTTSVILVTTTPIWVVLLSVFVYRQKVEKKTFLGLIIALIGGIVIGLSDRCGWGSSGIKCTFNAIGRNEPILGILLALLGAWCAAGYLTIGKSLRRKLPLIPYTAIVYSLAAVILFGITFLILNERFVIEQVDGFLYILGLALIPQVVGHTCFNWSIKYLSATTVSTALLGEPIGSTILAILFLREYPSVEKILAGLVILVGIYLVIQSEASTT